MTLVLAAANCNTVPAWWHWDCQCDTRHAWPPIGCFTGYGLSCPFHRNFHRFLDATDSALAQPQLTLALLSGMQGGCERVYGRRMRPLSFPGWGGNWDGRVAEWLEARETARRHSRLALRTTPGSIPARCSAKARVHRGPGVQGVPRSVASHR